MIDNKRLSGFVFQCIAEFGYESQTDILQEECAELCAKLDELAKVVDK